MKVTNLCTNKKITFGFVECRTFKNQAVFRTVFNTQNSEYKNGIMFFYIYIIFLYNAIFF